MASIFNVPCRRPYTAEFSKSPLRGWVNGSVADHPFLYAKNPEITLTMLMQEPDAQKILTLSGYKPEK